MEPESDVAILITVPGQPDPIAGSRRLRKISTIEGVARMLMGSMGRPRGARCDVWDRNRRLSWAWVCDGLQWRASEDIRPAPWVEAERARAAAKLGWRHASLHTLTTALNRDGIQAVEEVEDTDDEALG